MLKHLLGQHTEPRVTSETSLQEFVSVLEKVLRYRIKALAALCAAFLLPPLVFSYQLVTSAGQS